MEEKTMRVRLTFIDDILGTAADPELHEKYIASKAPDAPSKEEEIAALGTEEVVEKGKTRFPRDKDDNPIFWNYQIKGFFKSACSALRQVPGTESKKIKAYKKMIDLRIFPFADASDFSNRAIVIHTNDPIGDCQRPLRAQTPQGERVAISDSESIAAGAWVEFDILMLGDDCEKVVREWLDYGRFNGLGQWRNSGKGAFRWEEVTE